MVYKTTQVVRLASILLGCLVYSYTWSRGQAFRIAAFNVQALGPGEAKMSQPEILNVITKIIQRYDIILIQEVTEKFIDELLEKTNALGPSEYDLVISDKQGRLYSEEQYAFLYRATSGIIPVDTFKYPDEKNLFERSPFAVRFTSLDTVVEDFTLVGFHASPETTVSELNQLPSVLETLRARWRTDGILILGDFNADCHFVTPDELEGLALRTTDYQWLIGDEDDTTVKSTNCAYDRLVLTGEKLWESVVEESAKVFRYDKEYNLERKLSESVSNHFPIEVELKKRSQTSDRREL